MIDFLYRAIPLIICMPVSMIIYLNLDKKHKLTNKVSSLIKIKQEWKACFCICCTFLLIISIGILGIYAINIPDFVYYVLSGIIAGIGGGISTTMTPENINLKE